MVCDIQHYFRLAIYTTDLPLCPAGNAPYSWGTPCGGPVCIYHMSRWYQTGSMQRNELTKAEQRTWVYKLVCMCAWVWRTRTFYNYWKKRSWKEAEGFKMILLAKCFPVGGKKKGKDEDKACRACLLLTWAFRIKLKFFNKTQNAINSPSSSNHNKQWPLWTPSLDVSAL